MISLLHRFLPFFVTGLAALLALSLCTQCRSGDREVSQNVNITVSQQAADGLDLEAVTNLLKDVKTPEELEQKINAEQPRINNLDLNEDDTVDYVKVDQYSAEGGIQGFSLSTELAPGDIQELATIELKEENGTVNAQTTGNSNVYGSQHYHHSSFGLSDMLLWSFVLNNTFSRWNSPYGFNNYPRNFQSRRTLPPSSYQSGLRNLKSRPGAPSVRSSRTAAFTPSQSSPNRNQTSSRIKAPLKNPTTSQRSFQKRNPSRTVRRGGFGTRPRSATNSGSFRSSGSTRSRSSFGRGK